MLHAEVYLKGVGIRVFMANVRRTESVTHGSLPHAQWLWPPLNPQLSPSQNWTFVCPSCMPACNVLEDTFVPRAPSAIFLSEKVFTCGLVHSPPHTH